MFVGIIFFIMGMVDNCAVVLSATPVVINEMDVVMAK